MGCFLILFFLTIGLCLWSGSILEDNNESISAKIVIPVITAIIAVIFMSKTVEDYRAVEKNGTIPDTTVTVKNGVADTVIEYRINHKYK